MIGIFDSLRTSDISLKGILTKSLIFFGVVYLILISSSIEGLLNPLFLSVLLLFLFLTKSRGDLGIELPTLFFILVLILTSFTSFDPRRSFYEVWLIGIGIFIIFVVSRIVQAGFSSRTLVNFLLILGLGFMIFSWLDAGRWYMTWRSFYPEEWIPGISYRLNGGNTIAAYFHGIHMLGIARLVYSRTRMERVAIGAYCLSAVILIFLSSSRGAYLSMAGGLGFLVVLKWEMVKGWAREIHKVYKRYRYVFIGMSVIFLLIGAGSAYLYLQSMQSHPTHGNTMQSRTEFWRPAWNAFLQSPWVGKGPYTFAGEYMQANSIPPREIFLHSHSAYLDILSGSGLIGLLASGWLMAAIVYQLWHAARKDDSNNLSAILGALLALASFLVHNIFDGLYLMPFAAFNLCIFLGAALGEKKKTERKFTLISAGLGIVVTAVAWANFWMITPYQNALRAAEEGNFELAAQQFSVSVQRDPTLVLSHQQLGMVESLFAYEGDQDALNRAIKAMEDAVGLDPAYSPNHANLGALYKESGELEQAIASFIRAIELAPGWAMWQLNLGEIYELQEDWDLSAKIYAEALSLEPSWGSDGFWTKTPFRGEVLANWQELRAAPSEDAYLYSEDEAVHQASAIPILEVAAQKLEEQDLQAAERLLGVAQLAFFPNHTPSVELIWLRAEFAASKRDWETALSLGEEALEGYRLQGAYGPGSAGKTHYGRGVFRRSIMEIELVPQLSIIQLPEPWMQRMVKLSGWYLELGNLDGCEAIFEEMLDNFSDFTELYPELGCHTSQ